MSWFPDIRLSGIRQSDFCLSTYAYHTFAYQDLCLSEAEFEIRTIAHQGRTSAYQKLKHFCEYFCLCLYCLHIAKSEWRNKGRETPWKRSKPYRFATYQRIFQNPPRSASNFYDEVLKMSHMNYKYMYRSSFSVCTLGNTIKNDHILCNMPHTLGMRAKFLKQCSLVAKMYASLLHRMLRLLYYKRARIFRGISVLWSEQHYIELRFHVKYGHS